MKGVSVVVVLVVVVMAGLADARIDAQPTIAVAFSKGACRVSPKVVPPGTLRLRLSNRTARTAIFSAGSHSARVAAGRTRAVDWRFAPGRARYKCRLGSTLVGRGFLTVTAVPASEGPTIAVTGPPEVVFDWTTQRCDEEDIPDFPARAFRDAQGAVQLIASHHMPRRMVGSTLDGLRRECRPVMTSHRDPRPEAFDDSEWIVAPYTPDGNTVYALLHNEYHGQDHGSVYCPSGDNGRCWYDALTLGVSTDGGATYRHAAPPTHLIASMPWRYVPDQAGIGYYGGTNIVRNPADGHYYALIGRAPLGLGHGPCVIRTPTLDEPGSWRFWDGEGFNGVFVNPYTRQVADPASRVCPNVLDVLAESLSWNTHLQRWLLVGSKGFSATDAAFFLSTSTDLVHWTPPRPFHSVELVFTYACGEEHPKAYASFIDPASPERNFDVTGRTGWLYYTQFHYRNCRMTFDRDLVRIPVEVSGAS